MVKLAGVTISEGTEQVMFRCYCVMNLLSETAIGRKIKGGEAIAPPPYTRGLG